MPYHSTSQESLMSDVSQDSGRGPFQRQVEIGVALATALFGIVVMLGSMQVGIGWGVEGPKAGFFPFYVGAVIVLSSGVAKKVPCSRISFTFSSKTVNASFKRLERNFSPGRCGPVNMSNSSEIAAATNSISCCRWSRIAGSI